MRDFFCRSGGRSPALRRPGVYAGLAAAGLLITGCSAPDAREPSAADIERYMAVASENSALRWQVDYNLGRVGLLCMEERGFDVQGEGYEETFIAEEPMFQDRTSQLASVGVAVAPDPDTGYLTPIKPWENTPAQVEESAFNQLPEDERTRWWEAWGADGAYESVVLDNGQVAQWPTAGCLGAAYTALFGEDGYASFIQETVHAQGGLIEGWEDEEAVVLSRREWTSCMEDAGFDGAYASPDELRRASGELVWAAVQGANAAPDTEDFVEAELELAAADLACQERTGVAEVEYDAYAAQLAAQLAANEERVFAYDRTAEEVLVRAQEILAAGHL